MKVKSSSSLIRLEKEPSSTPMFVIAVLAMIQVFLEALDAVPVVSQVVSLFKLPVLLAFWLVGYLFIYGSTTKIKTWMWFGMAWLVLLMCFSILGDDYSGKRLIMDGSILFLALIFDFFHERGEIDKLRALVVLSLVCMEVTILYTCVQLQRYPLLSKVMTTGSYDRMQSQLGTIVLGAGGYDFVYGSLSLFPVLILLLKTKFWLKPFILVFLASATVFILMAQYTIAILFLVISVLVSLMIQKKLRSSMILFLVLALVVLYCSGAVEAFLRWLIPLFPSSSLVVPRLKIVLNIIVQQNLNSFYRTGTYTWNLQSFAARPYGNVFVNCFTTQPVLFDDPNHLIYPPDSEWLYLFSYYGIFLAPVFIAFLISFLHVIYKDRKYFNSRVLSGSIISYVLIFIIGILNTLFRSTVFGGIIFFIIPSLLVSSQEYPEAAPISVQEALNEGSMDLQHYASNYFRVRFPSRGELGWVVNRSVGRYFKTGRY